jgi:hypothetical protein
MGCGGWNKSPGSAEPQLGIFGEKTVYRFCLNEKPPAGEPGGQFVKLGNG